MRQPSTVVSIPVVVLLVAVTALLAGHAGAVRVTQRPVSIGTVNLTRVMEDLHERAEWDAQMRAREEALLGEIRGRQLELNGQKERLDALPEGPDAERAREELALELIRLDTWFSFQRDDLDRERALMWKALYRSIRGEAGRLAAAEGLDLIVVNDSVNELRSGRDGNMPAEAQMLQQIATRRVLFAGREVDITDRLVTRMNNARAARP